VNCGLKEELKWSHPCYTFDNKNIILLGAFKEYCGVLFINGALLKDPYKILVQQTENVQASRQLRINNENQLHEMEGIIKEYVLEAIENERAGLKVELKKTSEFTVPEEFEQKLSEVPSLKAAFEKLTPGRQRGYLLHFSAPKQAKTREARVEKYIPKILAGKGLED
jgi:uncharacterized protein YdeI (YjbR/CyaY-like superfamily)